jgi:hypothetical protein
MKLKDTSAYSRETLERLAKVLEQYKVMPWLNPATNAISIKRFNFNQHCPMQPCRQE